MKTLRLLPALVASCLFVAASIGLQATEGGPLVWVGGMNLESGDPDDATFVGNWNNGIFTGTSSDSLSFGDMGSKNVYIGGNIGAGSISFGNGSSSRYDFHGEGTSLLLYGDLTADPGSSAQFHSDLDVLLSPTLHTMNIGADAKIEFGSDISDWDGTGSIDKTGDGTLMLGGYNTFYGGVSVHAGTLALGSDSDHSDGLLASAVGRGTLKLYSGSTLSMTDDTEHAFTLYNDIDLDCSGGTVTVSLGSASQLTLESYIYGAAGLYKQGAGTLVLNNETNSFSGGVSVHEGTLLLGTSSSAAEGIIGPVGSGTLKLYDGTTLGVSTTTPITLHNNVDLDCRDTANVTVQTGTGQSLTLAGNISGSAELTKTGTGTLTLTGDNSFTGDLYVNGGTLNVGSNTGTGLGAVEMGLSSSTVNFTTSAPVIHGLAADLSSDNVFLINGATLTIDQEGDSTFAGSIDAHGGASVVKSGRGTLTFSNSNDYDGTTTISGGTLVYGANNAFGLSTVVINGGALKIANGVTFSNNLTLTSGKLAGNFSFTTPQTFGTGVTLSPGNSPGTIGFTSLTVNDGLATDFEFNAATGAAGTVSDLIAVSGTLDLSAVSAGGYTLRLISLMSDNTPGAVTGLTGPTSWTIFTAGTLTGFANGGTQFTLDSTQFYGGGIFTISQSGQDLLLNFTPVPEPSTYALMALGLVSTGVAAWRKRRGKAA